MKARNFLVVRCREKHVNWKKNTEDGENLFFKALDNRFWLTSKSYSGIPEKRDPERTQDPMRTQDLMKTQDLMRTEDPMST